MNVFQGFSLVEYIDDLVAEGYGRMEAIALAKEEREKRMKYVEENAKMHRSKKAVRSRKKATA